MGRAYFIAHGGGPMPLLGHPDYASLAASLRALGPDLAGAEAAIVVTAHWEEDAVALSTAERPGMLYDYYGFPEEAYRIRYPAPGSPALAEKVRTALAAEGIASRLDGERGFDHGTFVPMALLRPQADLPILQMSVLSSLDPVGHLAIGRALAPLLAADIALIGSGFSFHNMAALTGRLDAEKAKTGRTLAAEFHAWLDRTVCDPALSPEQRHDLLAAWATAPGARFCQPREEHLLPLHVCAGAALAAGLTAQRNFGEPVKGYQTSGYVWQ
jgi:aromatic ring-opening dioxygenase catalytic subunit (LigB family)